MKGIVRALLVIGTWALVFALPALPLEGLPNLGIRLPAWAYRVDMWPQTLALPGMVASVVFLVALLATRRFGDFERIAGAKLAGWGILMGLAAGALVVAVVHGESAAVAAILLGSAALLGALAAPASALVLRYLAARRRRAADASA